MTTSESIRRLWLISSALQRQTEAEIRDGTHGMTQETIADLKKAQAEMSDLRHQVHQLIPDFNPDNADEPCECSAADRLLVESMTKAAELELAGDCARAISTLEEFLALESSFWHREMAAEELQRLKDSSRS